MSIVVNLDVMLARRKMRSKELAEHIGITEQNVSLLKSGKVNVLEMISERMKLAEARRAFEVAGRRGVLKVLLEAS